MRALRSSIPASGSLLKFPRVNFRNVWMVPPSNPDGGRRGRSPITPETGAHTVPVGSSRYMPSVPSCTLWLPYATASWLIANPVPNW